MHCYGGRGHRIVTRVGQLYGCLVVVFDVCFGWEAVRNGGRNDVSLVSGQWSLVYVWQYVCLSVLACIQKYRETDQIDVNLLSTTGLRCPSGTSRRRR